MKMSRRAYGRESLYMYDENDGLGALTMKKITSDVDHSSRANKMNP